MNELLPKDKGGNSWKNLSPRQSRYGRASAILGAAMIVVHVSLFFCGVLFMLEPKSEIFLNLMKAGLVVNVVGGLVGFVGLFRNEKFSLIGLLLNVVPIWLAVESP